jgi:hypothetical protein
MQKMKKAILAVLILSFFNVTQALAQHEQNFFGQFLRLSKTDKKAISGQRDYFIVDTSEKGKHALPLLWKNNGLERKVLSGQQYVIKGKVLSKSIIVGELKKVVKYVEVQSVKTIALNELGATSELDDFGIQANAKGKEIVYRYKRGNINDTVTNSIIFGAGAALLGSMLLGK